MMTMGFARLSIKSQRHRINLKSSPRPLPKCCRRPGWMLSPRQQARVKKKFPGVFAAKRELLPFAAPLWWRAPAEMSREPVAIREGCPCAAGYVCSFAKNECLQLCHTKAQGDCPAGYQCSGGSKPYPAGYGVCVKL